MPKIQAVTDEMKAIADRIGENVSAMVDSQSSVKNCIGSILVHFGSNPRVMSALHLSNVTLGYRNVGESLTGYQEFLVNAANTYEWNDEQMAKWGDVMQNVKGVDIHDYHSPNDYSLPDMDSKYYDGSFPISATNTIWIDRRPKYNMDCLNCVYYARARMMEVLHKDQYEACKETGQELREHCVARFGDNNNRHDVFIESIDYERGVVTVSEANTPGLHPDGGTREIPLSVFTERKPDSGCTGLTLNFYEYW